MFAAVTKSSSLCSPHDRPMNPRGKECDFMGESADREVGGLTSQDDHALGAWMLAAFVDERWGKVRTQSEKDHVTLAIIP